MPMKPKHACPGKGPRYRSCPNLVAAGCCPECQKYEKAIVREYDHRRDEEQPWRQWMHSPRWRNASGMHKAEYPLCAECERQGRVTPVAVTDHIVPHNGDYDLFWNEDNWQSLCNAHHEEKHREDRWGR